MVVALAIAPMHGGLRGVGDGGVIVGVGGEDSTSEAITLNGVSAVLPPPRVLLLSPIPAVTVELSAVA